MSTNYTDVQAWQAANQQAQVSAQAEYQRTMAQTGREDLALRQAQFAWQQEMDKAGLTGMYQGQYTMPVQQWQAQTFGTWGAPTSGQQTLTAQQQAFQQAYQNAMAYGQYYAPGSTPTAGQQTLQGQQQQWSQGFQQQQFEAQQRQLQQQNAQQYLQLLSSLRGPADWAKYQQVLGSTPGGMRDLAAAAMGAYIPGGGATTGYQPQAASLQTMQAQINPAYAQQTQGPQNQAGYQPGGYSAAPQGQMDTGLGMGGTMRTGGAPSATVWDPNAQAGAAMGGAGAAPGSQNNPMGQLPAPNQIAAQSWKNLAPSQQQMLLGQYEAQGWDKGDVQALFNQSLPRYASNAPTAGTFRLNAA